jgi:hypothetical protein
LRQGFADFGFASSFLLDAGGGGVFGLVMELVAPQIKNFERG